MPVIGMPTALDTFLNTLLNQNGLSSYKIAANADSTTVVLRFSNMANGPSVTREIEKKSPTNSWRRKSPCQRRRDHQRLDNFLTTSKDSTELHLSTPKPSLFTDANPSNLSNLFNQSSGLGESGSSVLSPFSSVHDPVPNCQQCVVDQTKTINDQVLQYEDNTYINLDSHSSVQTVQNASQQNESDTSKRDPSETEQHTTTPDSPVCDDQTNTPVLIPLDPNPSIPASELSSQDVFSDSKFWRTTFMSDTRVVPRETRANINSLSRNTALKRIAFFTPADKDRYILIAETDDLLVEYDPSTQKLMRCFFTSGSISETSRHRAFFKLPLCDHTENYENIILLKNVTVNLIHLLRNTLHSD